MSQHGTAFRHRIGRLARLFGSADHSELVLEDGVLRLGFLDGSAETLQPSDVVSPIRLRKGLFWYSVRMRHRDGRRLRVAGIRRAEAQALGSMLEAWAAPALQRYFA